MSAIKRYSIFSILFFILLILILIFKFRVPTLVAYLITINLISLILYGIDKFTAIYNLQRIPEKLLHFTALIGGSPMALIAQQVFNHKVSKKKFLWIYWITVVIQLSIIYSIFYTDLLKEIF